MVTETGKMMEPNVPAIPIVGIVASENIESRAHTSFQDVACAPRIDLQSGAVRADPHNAAAAELQFAAIRAFSLHKTEIANGTVNPAIDPKLDTIGTMVGGPVLEPESDIFDEHLFFVSDAIAIVIKVNTEVRRMKEIKPVAIPEKSTRRIDIGNEFFDLIGMTVTIEVTDAQHSAAVRGSIQGPVAIGGNVNRALRAGGDKDGVVDGGGGGKNFDLEFTRDFHLFKKSPFLLGRGSRRDGGGDHVPADKEGSYQSKDQTHGSF